MNSSLPGANPAGRVTSVTLINFTAILLRLFHLGFDAHWIDLSDQLPLLYSPEGTYTFQPAFRSYLTVTIFEVSDHRVSANLIIWLRTADLYSNASLPIARIGDTGDIYQFYFPKWSPSTCQQAAGYLSNCQAICFWTSSPEYFPAYKPLQWKFESIPSSHCWLDPWFSTMFSSSFKILAVAVMIIRPAAAWFRIPCAYCAS